MFKGYIESFIDISHFKQKDKRISKEKKMLKVVEAFSGIGSQAKALENLNIEHKILCTIDWDINAIIAYDIIHNGKQNLKDYKKLSREDLLERVSKYKVSIGGKKPATKRAINSMSNELLQRLLCAIDRSNNLVNITEVTAYDIPNDTDLLTYSFPCQDLSVAGNWHGNNLGIDKDAHNRSGMLWEVERILKEKVDRNMKLPKFLLMENVSNILSDRHIKNFTMWTDYLESIGYCNKVYKLDASAFGIPQKRVRAYMLSVYVGDNKEAKNYVENYLDSHNFNDEDYLKSLRIKKAKIEKFLRLDYSKTKYREEADSCQPNNTGSRQDIYRDNVKIVVKDNIMVDSIPTVTTKQDRHPNSGVIDYFNGKRGKSKFRYLTPRECFLFMGFSEKDYECLIKNNFINNKKAFFNIEKLNRMAGNSIVVNVLMEIFKRVYELNYELDTYYLRDTNKNHQMSLEELLILAKEKKRREYRLIV